MIGEISPWLFDGWGGAQYEAVAGMFDLYEMQNWRRREMLKKITAYVEAVQEYRREQDK